MGIGALNYQGVKGGVKLNDVIEEFKYVYQGQTITAGDFVEYVNGVSGQVTETSVDTAINNTTSYTGRFISTVVLDKNRVFIAHSYSNSGYYLYGVVVTINNTKITVGTDTLLSNSGHSGFQISVELLPNGKVFIAHSYSSSDYLYGMVVTIDGTTISTGTDTSLVSGDTHPAEKISTCLLTDGNVFITYSRLSSYMFLYGIVCSVSDTTITKGTGIDIVYEEDASYEVSTQLLPNGNVFIAHSKYSDYLYLYGIVCTISGTTITAGTDTSLVENEYAGRHISAQVLPNGNVFIAHSLNDRYEYLYGIVCAISGTNITKGTDTAIASSSNTGFSISAQVLPNGKVFVAHSHTSNTNYLYGVIVTINGTAITTGSDTALNTNTQTAYVISSVLLANGGVFIAHSHSGYYLYAQIFGVDETNNKPTNKVVVLQYEQQAKLATQAPFNGIALSDGTGGTATAHNQQVKIARPNV